ncbi:hypothetical protein L7F22_021502 [Adiantum nelumboides]|nr:hypothetical protein [Adiantum nelumboides]
MYGIDYEETFTPVANMATVRAVIAVVAAKGWILYQMDVKYAFLHGDLQEEVYMEKPLGYQDTGHPDDVYADHSMYVQKTDVGIVINTIYVDDLIIWGDALKDVDHAKALLQKQSEMKYLGELRYFLGIDMARNEGGIWLLQKKYGLDMLMKHGMADSKPILTPLDQNLKLRIDEGEALDDATIRSISDYMFYFGSDVVTWSSKKQPTVALSSTEAEYKGAAIAACENYEQTIEDNEIQDWEAIDGFHLIAVPELKAQIIDIQAHQGAEYFLEDSQRTGERGKVSRGRLCEAGDCICETTGWFDPKNLLSVYAYIAKSEANEAWVEEKRKWDEEVARTSKRATGSSNKKEEVPKPSPEVNMEDAPKDKKQVCVNHVRNKDSLLDHPLPKIRKEFQEDRKFNELPKWEKQYVTGIQSDLQGCNVLESDEVISGFFEEVSYVDMMSELDAINQNRVLKKTLKQGFEEVIEASTPFYIGFKAWWLDELIVIVRNPPKNILASNGRLIILDVNGVVLKGLSRLPKDEWELKHVLQGYVSIDHVLSS